MPYLLCRAENKVIILKKKKVNCGWKDFRKVEKKIIEESRKF